MKRRLAPFAIATASLLGLLGLAPGSALAAPSPQWMIQLHGQPSAFDPTTDENVYYVVGSNVGDAATSGGEPTVLTDTLPTGVTATRVELHAGPEVGASTCVATPEPRCEFNESVSAGWMLKMEVEVEVEAGAPSPLVDSASISGGGSSTVSAVTSNAVSETPDEFGVQSFAVIPRERDSTTFTQAGGHPYELNLSGYFNNRRYPFSLGKAEEELPLFFPIEEEKQVSVDLPPGVVANPQAVPRCALASFWTSQCPADTQIGTFTFTANTFGTNSESGFFDRAPMYNLQPSFGHAADTGAIVIAGVPFMFVSEVETGGDYSVLSSIFDSPGVGLTSISFDLWGVPADARHDPVRGLECAGINHTNCHEVSGHTTDATPRPFLRMPTSCASEPLTSTLTADSWTNEGVFRSAFASTPPADGCNGVPFAPGILARTSTNLADSPSGLEADVHIPQNEAPEGVGAADLRDAVVTLPKGVRLNPSAAWGLQGCTEAQVELHGPKAPTCPNSSRIGKVEVETPLLDHPLPGSVYLAKPHENPFGSLLAMYAVVDDPVSGVIIKLPGRITSDPRTGQLTSSFEANPQLPFEDFHLKLFGGAQGSLRTPSVCGAYESTSVLTPWSAPESGPPATPADSFAIAGNCSPSEAAEPNSPLFHAGTESPQAGKFSPFGFKLARQDGSQEFSSIDTVLPPGLTGKLAGIPYCSEAQIAAAKGREHDGGGAEELASPSCPAASEVGTADIGAGAGPNPYYVTGRAYLAGPYQGGPISLVVITPAVAGPFDLGAVVTRVALHVNLETTQIHAVSDPLPTIIDGIPLDVRSIALKLNRPNFTLNPTSCNEMSVGGLALSALGSAAQLSDRFQVAGCSTLPFKPKLTLNLKGRSTRSGFPALTATLTMPPGDANVATAQVSLPHAEFLAQGHIDKTCGRPELAAHTCPPTAVYGFAKAWSPLLEKPLEGPVYLGTGFGHRLPDLVADLNGQIEVLLHGKVDTDAEDGLRNTFEVVPDAPVSKFVLAMKGGKKGLLENSVNLCAKPRKAQATFTAQNGKVADLQPRLQIKCPKKGNGKGHGKRHSRRAP